ncbi:rRNA methylase, partial [mine drainage metagenome]
MSRARDGNEILLNASFYRSLTDITDQFDIMAATSSVMTSNFKKFRRISITPRTFWENYTDSRKKIALVFGREGDGLKNEEISVCNTFIHIPSSGEYPVYNLSHAAGIILYESLMVEKVDSSTENPAKGEQVELMVNKIVNIMKRTNYPSYKIENTEVMLKRLITRSAITEHEFYKIMGIIKENKF